MSAEQDLERILNTENINISDEAEQYRYQKMLGKFYVKLNDYNPAYIYNQVTPFHMSYIDDLLYIEKNLKEEKYSEVVNYIKQYILSKKDYVLQGRIYYNLQNILERRIYSAITEFMNPVELKMKKIHQSSVFEYRLNNMSTKQIKKDFFDKLQQLDFSNANTQKEIDKFFETANSCFVRVDKKDCFDLLFSYILNDLKTDSLTLFMYHNEERRQFHILRYIKSKNTGLYDNCFLLNTDGVNYYYSNQHQRVFMSVKDFRVASILKLYNMI